MIPRAALVALGPVIGVATVLAALAPTDAPDAAVIALAAIAAGGLARAAHRGGEVALTIGLGAVGVAAVADLFGRGVQPQVVLWAAGAVAAGEAVGWAQRARTVAVGTPDVATSELRWSGLVVGATLVGGLALLGAGQLPAPGGLLGEVIALAALIVLAALAAAITPTGRTALRWLVTRRDP